MHTTLRHIVIFIALLCSILVSTISDAAKEFHFNSGIQQTTLLELYTSEGCSSCPPADRWMSQLIHDPHLWQQVVPVAFHVDYWNDLGWTDRFSRLDYSLRQRQYALKHYSKSVYTPGFFRNGREWRNWFYLRKPDSSPHSRPGILQVTLKNGSLKGRFEPANKPGPELVFNLALLGFNLTTVVKAGENEGKQLHHDFVVLSLHSFPGKRDGNATIWQHVFTPTLHQTNAKAIACWISTNDDPTPLQATGGWLYLKDNN